MPFINQIDIVDEESFVQKEFDLLLEDFKVTGHNQNIEQIQKAFNFAKNAHKGMKRRSGEPYIMHPLAVARIVVSEIGLGGTSICSALLHDVVEDTEYTVEDIEAMFGSKIAKIVEGLTKISGGVFAEKASEQAENFRKLLLTMSEDVRVVLIKIADRLHNMRTLGSMPLAKQIKISGETQHIYAPLAHRLGLFTIKTELEDLSFKFEHPEQYKSIEDKLAVDEEARNLFFKEFSAPIQQKISEMGYEFTLQARIKSVYSIARKMMARKITFEEVYDILADRIIFKVKEGISEKDQCWMIYSAITQLYKPHPERIRDWISTPKANGYEALHVTVMGPRGRWVEMQIRSERMDEIAEKGLAAHWKYKTGGGDESELEKWLKTISKLLEHPDPNAIDFLDTFKLNLFSSEIFVFTPKGDIKTVAKGSTALDFAYLLHSFLGNHCIGAKVNHKLVPLSYTLNSGDQVEILTSNKQTPQTEWLTFVTTAYAKDKISYYFKKQEKLLIIDGQKKTEEVFEKNQIPLDNENTIKLLNYCDIKNRNELYLQVAKGTLELDQKVKNIFRPAKTNVLTKYIRKPFNLFPDTITNKEKKETRDVKSIVIDKKKSFKITEEDADKTYILAHCCRPIPGDEVLGYVDKDMVYIHKRQCPVADRLKINFGNYIVSADWGTKKGLFFLEVLEIKGVDKMGVLIKIISIISETFLLNINKMNVECDAGIFVGRFHIFVHDTEEINNLCASIIKLKEINSIQRIQE
jgi:GTP diphosphokinase / guanosine-3',5'-bis(diphosphate) 3'-diphosphatase